MKNKKLIAIILCLTMMFTLIHPAFAEAVGGAVASVTTGSSIEFVPNEDTTGENQEDLVIPDEDSQDKKEPADDNDNRIDFTDDADATTSSSIKTECEECGQTDGHLETCSKYVKILSDEPAVGDTIWIKSGSKVYKEMSSENGWPLRYNYEVKIVEIITDETGAAIWYKFKFTTLGIGEILLHNYKYVKVENTSVEEPEQEVELEFKTSDGTPLDVSVTSDEKKAAIESAVSFVNDERTFHYYDIEATTGSAITVEGLVDVSEIPDNYAADVVVLHLLDSAEAIEDAVGNGLCVGAFGSADEVFAKEIAAAQAYCGESKVFYTCQDAEVDESGAATFETDSYSTFIFIVDFVWNGHKFSLNGGSEVMLSELLEELEIDYDISTVTDVVFSNESLISIEREEEDWKLTSLCAFGTDEWLSIYFSDGTIIEIKVTDPVLFYYLTGTDWCMETFENTVGDEQYVSNVTSITGANLGATHDGDTADVIIYARPGMAIRFDRYSTFSSITELDPNNNYTSKDGLWRWVSVIDSKPDIDGSSHNIVILESDITEVKETSFTAKIGDHGDSGTGYVDCNIKIVIVPDAPAPTLLKNALAADDTPQEIKNRYEIREIPVTLYNYDGEIWKNYYSTKSDQYFAFRGTSKGKDVTIADGNLDTVGNANGGGPVLGILANKLDNNKLPEMTQGYNVDLFSSAGSPEGYDNMKTVQNVDFEFVYDKMTGYYTYSSDLNHAQLDGDKVVLYREAMGTTASYALNGSSINYAAGGFYPYSDINKAVDSAGTTYSWTDWDEYIKQGYNMDRPAAPYGKDLVDSATKTEPYSTVDMHNGLQLAADFYLPADKLSSSGEPFIYQFTGDDDLWVFIDDTLVLDIGGGHTPVSGSINFTTGEVLVEGSYYTIGSPEKKENYRNSVNFEGDKMHSIKIFYLERYAGVSNCRMRFNLPLVPSNAVHVSKNLVNQDGEELSVTPDVNYTFTLYTAAGTTDDIDASNFERYANKPYTVMGAGAPTETQRTDANGQFKLKDGWTASFEGIPRFTEVYAVESNPNDGYTYVGSTVSVNRGNPTPYKFGTKTETKVMPLNTSINFDFVNKMQTQPLTVEKQVANGTAGLINPEQKFDFTLDFTKPILETGEGAIKANNSVNLTDGGTFQLGHNESITIPRVPVNMTFTLKEINPDTENNSFDAPKFESTICTTTETTNAFDTTYTWTMGDDAENKIKVTNQQRFNLTITKTGISPTDHHDAALGKNNKERQSTIYTVVGKIGDTEIVKMDVAICGNDSVTIKKLPVGTYTVEENENWSWRYTPAGGANKSVTIPANAQAQVDFENERDKQFWLSGDSYCENWWGGQNGVAKRKEYDKAVAL